MKDDNMRQKYNAGDTVEIVNKLSRGFVSKSIVEVIEVISESDQTQNLLLSDGIYNSIHSSEEIRFIK